MLFKSFIFLELLLIVYSRRECAHRDYGNGGTVCVCNITYCDDLNPLEKTGKGIVTLYETSLNGDRFRETRLKFNVSESVDAPLTQVISINRSMTYQKIIGFGGAFTDASGINLRTLPASMQVNAIVDYYSQYGIEYSMGRIPIAGCDFSTYAYSYDDVPNDDNLTHFSLTKEDMLYKIPYLQLAEDINPDNRLKYFGSPWSSPAWMKTTGTFNHGGVLIGEPGGKYYQIWANYFVKFIEAYEERGVNIWGLTVENEPGQGFNPNHTFNDLGFTAATERDFIKLNLGPTLEKAGYGRNAVQLMMYDDQRPNIFNWSDTILRDSEAAKYVSGVAFHWYGNTPQNVVNLDQVHNAYPQFFLLATEACEEWRGKSKHISLGNWATFERYAYDIITDLNHWATGWVDWNLALDLEGGPNWVSNFVDAPIIVNASAYEYYKQPFFYALGHFSKFVSPDSIRIEAIEKVKLEKFETIAFLRADNSTVVVALNLNDLPVELTIEDPTEGRISRYVKPHSLQSYIWYH